MSLHLKALEWPESQYREMSMPMINEQLGKVVAKLKELVRTFKDLEEKMDDSDRSARIRVLCYEAKKLCVEHGLGRYVHKKHEDM